MEYWYLSVWGLHYWRSRLGLEETLCSISIFSPVAINYKQRKVKTFLGIERYGRLGRIRKILKSFKGQREAETLAGSMFRATYFWSPRTIHNKTKRCGITQGSKNTDPHLSQNSVQETRHSLQAYSFVALREESCPVERKLFMAHSGTEKKHRAEGGSADGIVFIFCLWRQSCYESTSPRCSLVSDCSPCSRAYPHPPLVGQTAAPRSNSIGTWASVPRRPKPSSRHFPM